MSDIKHKTRFELIRDNTVINTVEPKMASGSNDLTMSTNSSIYSLPTLSFKSENSELNQLFMGYSKNDIVRLSVSHDVDERYVTMFEGEFFRKETKFTTKPNRLVLNIESIHSFYRLSLLELSSEKDFKNITFEMFVKNIMTMSDIKTEIFISSEIASLPIIGVTKNTNLFRLFKEACLMINASVAFNTNNTVNIESRTSQINQIKNREIISITDNDIISFESNNKI